MDIIHNSAIGRTLFQYCTSNIRAHVALGKYCKKCIITGYCVMCCKAIKQGCSFFLTTNQLNNVPAVKNLLATVECAE